MGRFEKEAKKMKKRGQMKIQQMAFMLIAVTLFFALVGMFILSVMFSNIKDSAASLEEKNALLLVSKLANSPEFSCGNAFGTTRSNCVDIDKAMALKNDISKYSNTNFWGVTGIEIVKLYPTQEKIELLKPKTGTGVSNYVALCRKQRKSEDVLDESGNIIGSSSRLVDACEIGKLVVTYTEKT